MEELLSNIALEEVRQIVTKHAELQLGCYFSSSEKFRSGVLNTSKHIDDFYWNSFGGYDETSLGSVLKELEAAFAEKNRSVAFYVDPSVKPSNALEELEKLGFDIEKEVLDAHRRKCVYCDSSIEYRYSSS